MLDLQGKDVMEGTISDHKSSFFDTVTALTHCQSFIDFKQIRGAICAICETQDQYLHGP